MLKFAVASAILLVSTSVDARPPAGPVDPLIAAWFQSLRRDSDRFPCCNVSDCRTVEAASEGLHYRAHIYRDQFVADDLDEPHWTERFGSSRDAWIDVPDNTITVRTDNPTGHPVLCYSVFTDTVFCFLPWEFGG